MSQPALFIDAYAALLSEGLHSAGGRASWGRDQRPVDDVRRDQVLDAPYPNFGKLSLPDKLAFAAACLMFRGYPECKGPRTGIAIGMPFGSLSTDIRYMESVVGGFPSPAVFSATLPSSAVAEIAIFFRLKGPDRVISEPHGSWLGALEAAARAVRLDKADVMVVVCLSALETRDRASSLLPGGAPGPNAAFAFLLTNDIRAGGMGARFSLELGPAEHPRDARPEDVYLRSLVELLDCRARGAIAVATESLVGRIVVG